MGWGTLRSKLVAGKPRTAAHADRASAVDRERTRALFLELQSALPEGDARGRAPASNSSSCTCRSSSTCARRFRNRGEPSTTWSRSATIGLIKSVDRFDPERGVEFSTYATPTIVGEIKRHFRDKGWAVRVPRRLQELRLSLASATSELSQKQGRSPTVAELAEHLGDHRRGGAGGPGVRQRLPHALARRRRHGDERRRRDADARRPRRGRRGLEGVEYRESLKPMLEQLPPREKRILMLRFFSNMTQSQIAAEIGISQMHVSRLLARTLAQLRNSLREVS